jgi:hypothetical protein
MLGNIIKVGLLAVFLILPAFTWSQPGPGMGGPGMMGMGMGRPGGMGGIGMDHPGPGKWMGKGPGMGMGPWWNHPEVREKLGLTEEQVTKLSEHRLATETRMIETTAKMKIAELQLKDLLSKKEASTEDIDKKIDEIGDLQKERVRTMIHQKRILKDILNEDQIKKVERFINARKMQAMKGRLEGVRDRMRKEGMRNRERRQDQSCLDDKECPMGKEGKMNRNDKGKGKWKENDRKRRGPDGPPPHRDMGMGPGGPGMGMFPPFSPAPEFGGPVPEGEPPVAPSPPPAEDGPAPDPEVGMFEGDLGGLDLFSEDLADLDASLDLGDADFE